jgi:hypothetical protein
MLNNIIFWGVTPYNPLHVYRRFGGTYWLLDRERARAS